MLFPLAHPAPPKDIIILNLVSVKARASSSEPHPFPGREGARETGGVPVTAQPLTVRPAVKEPTLRKWHRYGGSVLAPLIFLQALSGLFLSFEWMTGLHTAAGELLPGASPFLRFWDWVFVGIHYGGGFPGYLYHSFVGAGLIWLVVTGAWIFLKTRARLRKRMPGKI